jgi:two-component system, OmpR family, response regulator PrrA
MNASDRGAEAGGSGPRIMIVDDDPDVRLLLQVALSFDGLNIVGQASDGAEALSVAWRSKPQVVILDQNMPVMKGEETAPALRRILPEVRIIACSASFTEKPVWADEFVSKKDIAELPRRIQNFAHVA